MKFHVAQFQPKEWEDVMEDVHLNIFGTHRDKGIDRSDFILASLNEEKKYYAYVQCREFDSKSLYWSFGGVFPEFRNTPYSFRSTMAIINWCREHYDRLYFLVENTNRKMLGMAQKCDFLITGIKTFKNITLVEHTLEFGGK